MRGLHELQQSGHVIGHIIAQLLDHSKVDVCTEECQLRICEITCRQATCNAGHDHNTSLKKRGDVCVHNR